MAVLEGYQQFYSKKKNQDYFVLLVSFPFDPTLNVKCAGKNFDKIFVNESVFNMCSPDMVGKEVNFDYQFLGGNVPHIVGISVAVNKKG